ncbi:MAG: hypothetical protein GSR73_00705 [Desulfurococcales archaeon]|nr:hypothetical protein [Desulfurococcales archaeon]
MEEIQGPGYRIVVDDNALVPQWNEESRTLATPRLYLELDAKFSLVGERIAGLLLPPLDAYSDSLDEIINAYRKRIVAEQAADLVSRLGPLTAEARVEASFFPVSRAHMLWGTLGCLIGDAMDSGELARVYLEHASVAGVVEEGLVRVKPRRYREYLVSNIRRLQLKTLDAAGNIARYMGRIGRMALNYCTSMPEAPDPSVHVRLPEGRFHYECPGPRELAQYYLGVVESCKRSQWTSSTVICRSEEGERIAVKEYLKMIVKWLPASIASSPALNYLITPKSRLANEYRHLRVLRGVISTPEILGVCGDPAKAVMVRGFVEGEPVLDSDKPLYWRMSGEALAAIHSHGYVLGDPNPGNFVIDGGSVSLVDAEQARRFTARRGAWDLIVYVYYSVLLGKRRDLIAEGLRGYLDSIGALGDRVVRELGEKRLWNWLRILPVQYRRAREVFSEAGIELT